MDFHAAMETFAEAWVAANTQTVVNTTVAKSQSSPMSLHDLPTLLPKEDLIENRQQSPPTASKVMQSDKPGPSSSGKTLPIHCIVEQMNGSKNCQTAAGSVELDSYAIIPSSTLFTDIVQTALSKLGYSTETGTATGAIQFKNWKPLSFDAITNNCQMSVDDVLGELTSLATLKIQIFSQHDANAQSDVKEKLLQLLLNQSQDFLLKAGCPINKELLSQISKGDSPNDISKTTKDAFYQWYQQQLNKPKLALAAQESKIESPLQHAYPTVAHILNSQKSSGFLPLGHSTPRTRPRTSFDPDHEIPQLNKWFRQNQHPSRYQMMQYLDDLNSHETRKGQLRKPLDLLNIIHWFKNARAAVRKGLKALGTDGTELGHLDDSPVDDSAIKSEGSDLPKNNAVYIISKPDSEQVGSVADDSSGSDQEESGNDLLQPQDLSLPKPDNGHSQSQDSVHTTVNQDMNGTPEASLDGLSKKRLTVDEDQIPAKKIKAESSASQTSIHTENIKQEVDEHDDSDDGDSESESSSEQEDDSPRTPSDHTPSQMMVPMYSVPYPVGLYPGLAMHPMSPHFYGARFTNAQQMALNAVSVNRYSEGNKTTPLASPTNDSDSNENMLKDEKRRRHRVFIDPVTEIPLLEHWFSQETHPPHYVIEKYCEELNKLDYRQRYPKLNPKNVQLWFKNHRAKVKRLRLGQTLNFSQNGFNITV